MLKTKPVHIALYLVAVLVMGFVISRQYRILHNSGYDNQAAFVTELKNCDIVNDINCNVAFDVPANLNVTGMKLVAINSSSSIYQFNSIDIFGRVSKSVPMTKLGSIIEFPSPTLGLQTFTISTQIFSTSDFQNRLVVSAHAKSSPNNLKIRLLLYSK